MPEPDEMSAALLLRTFGRGWRKKCPSCGKASMFEGFFTMRKTCPNCGVRFERENGEYVASMYINLVITEVLFVILYVLLKYVFDLAFIPLLLILVPFNGLFPVWFYPRSKSLWAAGLFLSGSIYAD